MISPEILVLIPCHSLEDFPTEQTDQPAASLLNAFSVGYHPRLLAWTNEIPRWRRADDPPLPRRGQLILIPTVSDDWLPHGWAEQAREAGATVVSGLSDRQEMLAAALVAVNNPPDGAGNVSPDPETHESVPNAEQTTEVAINDGNSAATNDVETADDLDIFREPAVIDPDWVADFLALGTCWLLIELLTRRMRQFGNIDDNRFFLRAQSAAKAVIADDHETAETHLRACFEMLLEARERFYPVECYLLDLCLAVPDVAHERLLSETQQSIPFSLLISTNDLDAIYEKSPDLKANLKQAVQKGLVSVVSSEDRETSLPLLPLESALFHLNKGREDWRQRLGQNPIVWGRRRFGLSALLPQLLAKSGYRGALHVVLDDGIYPDAEYTKLRWRGVDGTLIDALSRIPLAADGAASYLRLPLRMSESMDHDQVAGIVLARWPEVSAPWFEDLRRSQKYAPCLGRFITLDRFFEHTELPGQLSVYQAKEYFSPLLIQHVARREPNPISRYVDHAARRQRFDVASWCQATATVLMGKNIDPVRCGEVEVQLEAAAPTSIEGLSVGSADALAQLEQEGNAALARIIMHGATTQPGHLIVNPLSFTRRIVVPLPGLKSPLAISGPVKAVEFDTAHPERSACVVEVPGCGYAWIPAQEPGASAVVPKQKLAEDGILRNDLFEVAINNRTGGIAHVRFHNERTKRLSQQLSFRFPRERSIPLEPGSNETTKSQYAEMRCERGAVIRSGIACGEIQTWGQIVDQANNERLASYRQSVRVWRGTPTIEIEIELSDVKTIDGDPWNNYFASRFAWNDSTAAVTRSIYHSAHNYSGERIETSDYIEVASESERLTIVPHGLPFHRQSGDRMVDAVLVVAGETQRKFRFTIAVNAPYPLEAAWSATSPAPVIPTVSGPPRSGATGWFFHVDARHVQITRLLGIDPAGAGAAPLEQFEHPTIPAGPGFALRLVETEGRNKSVKLHCFRRPSYARKRDFCGQTINELLIDGDAVQVDLAAFEVVDVELRFGE